jgi:hypothetical protein
LAVISVRLVVTMDSLVVEFWDRNTRPPIPKDAAGADETGRGLVIVGVLCRRWGYSCPTSGGKTVWGELDLPAYDLTTSDLPRRRRAPLLVVNVEPMDMPSYVTMERVAKGLRKL